MCWAGVGVAIKVDPARRRVTTGAAATNSLGLALQSLVLLVHVALEYILSGKLQGALVALVRRLVVVSLSLVGHELELGLEFELAQVARKLVSLASRGVLVLVVGELRLEDLSAIGAHQGTAVLSMGLHLRNAHEIGVAHGAFACFRSRHGCYERLGFINTLRWKKWLHERSYINTNELHDILNNAKIHTIAIQLMFSIGTA